MMLYSIEHICTDLSKAVPTHLSLTTASLLWLLLTSTQCCHWPASLFLVSALLYHTGLVHCTDCRCDCLILCSEQLRSP
ncbi:hypothetical protein K435DRAFT_312493 [Dendrothele bispora CBS 962.96]|uniref:Uncharacterized protein n=1 Tax=Dendrothele bispora (strain CBS 962.96) TaxID=1314807 RepID=A0A4S8KIE7_DENBC|nr:hypothetical protein K435DRAFT_312493 [Dendrothele bispora CBS 962.96]